MEWAAQAILVAYDEPEITELIQAVLGPRDSWQFLVARVVFVTDDSASVDTREFLESTRRSVVSEPFGLQDLLLAVGETPAAAYQHRSSFIKRRARSRPRRLHAV